jgi:NTE family protein
VVLGGLEGGLTPRGTLPLPDAFTLGGPRRLSGFANDQILGGEYALARIEGQYRLDLEVPVLGLSLIGGVLAETGRMNKRLTEPALDGWQRSFGAYLAASTVLGPLYVGVSDAKNGKARFYLFIGTP